MDSSNNNNNLFMSMQQDDGDMLAGSSSIGMPPALNGSMVQQVAMPVLQKKGASKRPSKKASSSSKVKDEEMGVEDGDVPPAKKAASKSKSGSVKKKKVPPKQSNVQMAPGMGTANDNNATGSGSQFGHWKPEDDYALITAVQQTCDLTSVYLGVRFSSKFSLREIQERWYTLLYDPIVSTLAKSAIQNLPIEVICRIERETLFSKAEEVLLSAVPSNSQIAPSAEVFDQLLHSHSGVFHPSRSPYILLRHWQRLRRYHMLNEQQNTQNHEVDLPEPFSDVEDDLMAASSTQGGGGAPNVPKSEDACVPFMPYSSVALTQQRRQIRRLENESSILNAIAEPIVGISPGDFHQPQTLAVLRGRAVRYLMRSPEITIGRNASSASSSSSAPDVNVDLSLEGPAWRVSRRQAVITMKSVGEFYIENVGRTSFVIDSKPILPGSGQIRLQNNSTLEIGGCLHFFFLINPDLTNQQQQQQQQQALPTPSAQQTQMAQSANPGGNQPGPQNVAHSSTPPTQMTSLSIGGGENNNTQQFAGPVGVVMHNQQTFSMGNVPPNMNPSGLVATSSSNAIPPPNVNSLGGGGAGNVASQFPPAQQRPVYMQQQPQQVPPQQPQQQQQSMPPGHGQFPQAVYQPMPVQHHFGPPVGSPPMMAPNSSPHFISGYRLVSPQQQPPPQQPGQYQPQHPVHPQQLQHMQQQQQQQHPH